MGHQRVVVGVRDHGHLAVRRRQSRRLAELHGVARDGEREFGERRKGHQRVVHAVQQDLPAALVADDVVDLLAVAVSVGDHVAHALGQRAGLVDERALRGGEELARELRHGGDVVVTERRMRGLDPARDLAGEPDHLAQLDTSRVHLEDRRHHGLAHAHRMQPGVGEGFAEGAELAACLFLPVGIGYRPPIRGVEPLGEDALELRDVGLAEGAPEVTRRDHAVSRQHTDAEAHDHVLARALGVAVLCGRVLALDRLEADVGVSEVSARPGAGGDEVAHHGCHLRNEIGTDRGRHGRGGVAGVVAGIVLRRAGRVRPRRTRPRRCRPVPPR